MGQFRNIKYGNNLMGGGFPQDNNYKLIYVLG